MVPRMITLFNVPQHKIDTSKYKHLLHDGIVTDFEQAFAEYVGAKHAVSLNSASSAIFLFGVMRYEVHEILQKMYGKVVRANPIVKMPTMIPPVVYNSIINSGHSVEFTDDIEWVGNDYVLWEGTYKVVDSAQKVERNQYKSYNKQDVAIFSFYPTKPVNGCDGGMLVSDDKTKVEAIRELCNNGMTQGEKSWERRWVQPGWKMHMNSLQADFAMQSLANLDKKQERIAHIRDRYNMAFNLSNKSKHLYTINVRYGMQENFIRFMRSMGIESGIHYKCMHTKTDSLQHLPISSHAQFQTCSIPLNETMTDGEVDRVIDCVNRWNKGKEREFSLSL